MDITGKKIAIIGGAGFVGTHTLQALLNEPVGEVIVVDNFKRGKIAKIKSLMADSRVKVVDVPTDIVHLDTLEKSLEGADGVIHLASLWLTYSQQFPRSALEENVLGTFNVFQTCIKLNIEKVVFASSASVYGNAVSKPMTEEHPLNNMNVYGATKICKEAIATAMHHSYGLPIIGLRYFNIYGPGQDSRGAYNSVVVKMLDNAEKNLPLIIHGDGTQSYDFISVHDIARANLCALKAEKKFGMYNVCTGVSTSINTLAEIIRSSVGSESTINYQPDVASFVTDRVGCSKKAEQDLGFRYKTSVEQGMGEFCQWRRQTLEEYA